MNRSDLPYALLTLVFGLAIFLAGRMSAPAPVAPEPRVVVVHDATPPSAPSVVVIASATPEPPMALLPEPSVSAPQKAFVAPIKAAPKDATPKSETIILEETPEVPANPYKSSNAPGF